MSNLGSCWCHNRRGSNVLFNGGPSLGNQQEVENAIHSRHRGDDSIPVLIDSESLDDDVVILSPRAFAEAINNKGQQHGQTVLIDLDSEEHPYQVTQNIEKQHWRVFGNREFVDADLYVNVEACNCVDKKANSMVPLLPPSKELTFNCPICMGPLVDETSTKCGHIFCKKCIMTAIAAQKKCPTCRKKTTLKDIIRVYLPTTSCS